MLPPPELVRVSQPRVACDGASDIPGGAALGHPRVWLQIDEHGYVDCGYCDRRFVLIGGPADGADHGQLPDIAEGASPQ
ncbi:zinc-finger domain-containing protein [Sphingomonas citri]|uniref:Zinc-finger domain-containing protein n=1 Tax=Sphingomonas citri TaxID=2862499 RepID=A0ABS7BSA3_9SPHN|nr:zinc-finger domain-containing protein [Sphingomonas citri]MBW6532479.1 zinc-finger domain-containing protein [Sphingomonas citri]